jgi:hypothetical protein
MNERSGGPRIRRCGCVSRRTLNPVQGLEIGRDRGEARVMTSIRE